MNEACRLGRLLGSQLHLVGGHLGAPKVREASVGPVAVRDENGRLFRARALRPIEIPAYIMSRIAGEVDFFDGVIIAVDLAVNHRIERRFGRQRPESIGDQHLLAQLTAAHLPCLQIGRRLEEEVLVVEGADVSQAGI